MVLKLYLDSCEHTHTLKVEKARIISAIYSESISTFNVVTVITTALFAVLRIDPRSRVYDQARQVSDHQAPPQP